MMSIENKIILFAQNTTCYNKSYIDVTDGVRYPNCINNGSTLKSKAEAKIALQYGDDEEEFHDIYLYKKQLIDIFIFSLNKAREDKLTRTNYISNTVLPDERWMFRSHQLLLNNFLLKLCYNTCYKINATIDIYPEKASDYETGRMIIDVSLSYRFLFMSYKFKKQPKLIKLNTEQIMELQTELYKLIPFN